MYFGKVFVLEPNYKYRGFARVLGNLCVYVKNCDTILSSALIRPALYC